MKSDDVVYICLTPVRDEEWVLPSFLQLNAEWADHIIILDQCSKDRTPEIAKNHPKVTYLRNDDPVFDELYRQKVLYEEARRIKAKKRIIFFLDADEYIPPALIGSPEWNALEALQSGTRIYTRWIQVLPGLKTYFKISDSKPFGYIDDGAEIVGSKIHNDRVPPGSHHHYCDELVNIHLGYTPFNRNYKKHTWYMLWEFLNNQANPFDLNTNYRKFVGEKSPALVKPVAENWISGELHCAKLDIDAAAVTWWDKAIIAWIAEYGEAHFKKLNIWELDWNAVSKRLGHDKNIIDPRSRLDRYIMRYISITKYRKKSIFIKVINFILRKFWT